MTHSRLQMMAHLLGTTLAHRQLFFLGWLAVVGLFVGLMVRNYQKHTQRNFRRPSDRSPIPSTLRALHPPPSEKEGHEAPKR